MLILNYTHPLTDQQLEQIEALAGERIDEVRAVPVQINQEEPLAPQIEELIAASGLTPQEWQTRHILINPPGYVPAASVLLAMLHGRIGHFPTLLRIRPRHGATTSYDVSELLNLQSIRDLSRIERQDK